MCGIIGFAKNDCLTNVYNGLELLEYRGYDSVGIAFNDFDSTYVIKQKGRVHDIYDKIQNVKTNIAIGHTRWATHGKPSEINAHPHKCGLFTIVHNGIIENADALRKELVLKGYLFLSETDSEVIAVLLQDCFDPSNVLAGIKRALSRLIGSYALAVLCEYKINSVFLAKKENPLIIGQGDNFYCFASDTPALIEYAQNLYRMKDGEIAEITQDDVKLYDVDLNKIKIEYKKTSLSTDTVNKGQFETFMLKEIFETPKAVKQTIDELSSLNLPLDDNYGSILIIGCGTAYHAGLYAKELMERILHINPICMSSNEFLYSNCVLTDNSLVIAISQSGETADTINGIKTAKEKGAKVLAITNVPSSTVTTLCDYRIVTKAGVEIAVGATKSYATQIIATQYVVYKLAKLNPTLNQNLPCEISKTLECSEYVKKYVEKSKINNLFFLGMGADYPTALEGALKSKEIAYVFSDACLTGEIKHGPLAMVTEKTLVVCIVTKENYRKITKNAINEVKSRGAKVLAITCYPNTNDDEIVIPNIDENDRAVLSIIPLQLLSYYFAIHKNIDPDKPRNLAKSVTVG